MIGTGSAVVAVVAETPTEYGGTSLRGEAYVRQRRELYVPTAAINPLPTTINTAAQSTRPRSPAYSQGSTTTITAPLRQVELEKDEKLAEIRRSELRMEALIRKVVDRILRFYRFYDVNL